MSDTKPSPKPLEGDANLFLIGERAYIAEHSRMWQDIEKTIPAIKDGDPVAVIETLAVPFAVFIARGNPPILRKDDSSAASGE